VTVQQTDSGDTSQQEVSGRLPAAHIEAAIRFAQFLGTGSAQFSAALVALGTAFGIFSVAARLDDPKAWGFSELLVTFGFGALLVILGFIEEQFVVRTADRAKKSSSPPSGNNGQGPPAELRSNGGSLDGDL
jgi:hypothetical protein